LKTFKLLLDKKYKTLTKKGKVGRKIESIWVRIEADSLYNASKKAEELYPEYIMSMGSPLMKGDYVNYRLTKDQSVFTTHHI